MSLATGSYDELPQIKSFLSSMELEFILVDGEKGACNVYFGRPECISALRRFSTLKLEEMSEEEDFMIGIMLGYDLCKQCARYDRRKLDRELACEPCAFRLSEATIA